MIGETWSREALARTLEKIAATTGEAFYRGELARGDGGTFRKPTAACTTTADFAHTCAATGSPRSRSDYRGVTVHEIPPNGQGIAALMALGILQHFDLAALPADSVQSQHLQIEAMKLAFADAYRYVADPRFMRFPPSAMLDPDYLAARARLIDTNRAQDFGPGDAAARRHGVSHAPPTRPA